MRDSVCDRIELIGKCSQEEFTQHSLNVENEFYHDLAYICYLRNYLTYKAKILQNLTGMYIHVQHL